MKSALRIAVSALVLGCLLAPDAAACESCREAISSGQQGFAEGINRSILFMLGMVFGLPTVFSVALWRTYRSADARALKGETLVPPGVERWDPRARD